MLQVHGVMNETVCSGIMVGMVRMLSARSCEGAEDDIEIHFRFFGECMFFFCEYFIILLLL